MVNRRIFFKHAGTFALGALFLPACNVKSDKQDNGETTTEAGNAASTGQSLGAVGLQLYSVRDVLEQDLQGTLQKLAEMGYTEVESYPGTEGHYYGMTPEAFSKMLTDLGMRLVSSHFGSGTREGKAENWHQATMLSKFDELVEKAVAAGQQYLTCSWMDESLRKTPDDLKRTAELFNKTGEACKKAGLTFAYHNHSFEFQKVGDQVLYDFMLNNTDPDLVKYEMDIYWVVAGGNDPLAYFKQYPNRFPLGHIKGMDKQDNSKNTVLGNGTIDYVKILKAGQEAGMKHFLVEQESYAQPSMDAMRENYNYLSKVKI